MFSVMQVSRGILECKPKVILRKMGINIQLNHFIIKYKLYNDKQDIL